MARYTHAPSSLRMGAETTRWSSVTQSSVASVGSTSHSKGTHTSTALSAPSFPFVTTRNVLESLTCGARRREQCRNTCSRLRFCCFSTQYIARGLESSSRWRDAERFSE